MAWFWRIFALSEVDKTRPHEKKGETMKRLITAVVLVVGCVAMLPNLVSTLQTSIHKLIADGDPLPPFPPRTNIVADGDPIPPFPPTLKVIGRADLSPKLMADGDPLPPFPPGRQMQQPSRNA